MEVEFNWGGEKGSFIHSRCFLASTVLRRFSFSALEAKPPEPKPLAILHNSLVTHIFALPFAIRIEVLWK